MEPTQTDIILAEIYFLANKVNDAFVYMQKNYL